MYYRKGALVHPPSQDSVPFKSGLPSQIELLKADCGYHSTDMWDNTNLFARDFARKFSKYGHSRHLYMHILSKFWRWMMTKAISQNSQPIPFYLSNQSLAIRGKSPHSKSSVSHIFSGSLGVVPHHPLEPTYEREWGPKPWHRHRKFRKAWGFGSDIKVDGLSEVMLLVSGVFVIRRPAHFSCSCRVIQSVPLCLI
jgi:hypothetical protein